MGMGADSAKIFSTWVEDPSSRDFPLSSLILLSAQTGLESQRTQYLMERHIYPVCRRENIRVVQVARASWSEIPGIITLSDTTQPNECHTQGYYTLADYLLRGGGVPQYSGARLCSCKFKGWVLNRWIDQNFPGQNPRIAIGFNADENARREKAELKGLERPGTFYPLQQQGIGREQVEADNLLYYGESFDRSACTICPFQITAGTREEIIARHRARPDEAAIGLLLEYIALSLNPRQTLFKNQSFQVLLEQDGNATAIALLQERLDNCQWGIYEVRRVRKGKKRSLRRMYLGPKSLCIGHLKLMAQDLQLPLKKSLYHGPQIWLQGPETNVEHLYTAIPAYPEPNDSIGFDAAWAKATGKLLQRTLWN